jgi:hypothetical protein
VEKARFGRRRKKGVTIAQIGGGGDVSVQSARPKSSRQQERVQMLFFRLARRRSLLTAHPPRCPDVPGKNFSKKTCRITGSSIKRIAAEAALPVQTVNQKDIQRSGFTSVTTSSSNCQSCRRIQNLADVKPPLSLRATGSHQLGYDPRYASAIGRTFYLSAQYKY